MIFAAVLVLASVAPNADAANAPDVVCRDTFQQGALIRCQTAPDSRVTWDGKSIAIASDGSFVFGIDWKAESGTLDIEKAISGTDTVLRATKTYMFDPRQYKTEIVNGLPPKTVDVPDSWKKRRAIENGKVRKGRAAITPDTFWAAEFARPATGRISGVFGSHRILNGKPRSAHYGLDIANDTGTPVFAPAGGMITLAAPDFLLEGGIVIIDHGFGVTSTLFHMNSVDVGEGQRIKQGDQIGTIGATGRATGPHVDWRVNWKSVRLDPQLLISDETK